MHGEKQDIGTSDTMNPAFERLSFPSGVRKSDEKEKL